MRPASAFRHPVSQSGTGAMRYRSIPVPDLVPLFRYRTGSSVFLFIPIPDLLDAGQSDIPAPLYTLHVHTAVGGNEYTLHVRRQQLNDVILAIWYLNAGMSECRRNVSPASAFHSVVSCLSPASAIRHQGSVRYRWSRSSPALLSYIKCGILRPFTV